MSTRFGPNFPKLFAAAILQEASFFLLVHLPGYLESLGTTESLIGILYAAGAVLSLLFRPALGRILDLTHRRTVLLVAGILNATVVLSLALTTVWGPWLWCLFLAQRVLQIALFTTMLTYGADSMPLEHRTQGLALMGLSGLIPIAVGGVAGDLIIDAFGYSALFVTAAMASLGSWLLVWRLPLLPILGHRPRRGFWAAMAQRNLLPLWLATLALSIGMETIFTFTRTFVANRGVGSTGLFFGVYGVTAASMRIFGGRHYDRIPHRPLVAGALLAYGAGLLFLGVAESATMVALAGFAAGLSHGAVFPILTSQVVSRARTAERGSAMAIFTSIFDIALLVAAPAVGFLIDGFSYRLAFGGVAVAVSAGAVLYGWWDHRVTSTEVAEVPG
ncbi:MAG TPA: MFS transporter [Acidimicrobiia bacterium]|nr:MFS transporter [Acidimicrobiia bacterium]